MAKLSFSLSGEGREPATRVRGVVKELRAAHVKTIIAPGDALDFLWAPPRQPRRWRGRMAAIAVWRAITTIVIPRMWNGWGNSIGMPASNGVLRGGKRIHARSSRMKSWLAPLQKCNK